MSNQNKKKKKKKIELQEKHEQTLIEKPNFLRYPKRITVHTKPNDESCLVLEKTEGKKNR